MEENKKFKLVSSKKTRYLLPNILTLAGVCLGISSIKFAIDGSFGLAVNLILIAAILDALDGRIARLIKGTSEFGKELDSLTDFVSFGIAPVFILYFWELNNYGKLGWAITLIYSVCCVLRLARFNLTKINETEEWKNNFFEGVPSPAGGLLILMPLIYELTNFNFGINIKQFTPYLTILIAILLVSKIPTLALKKISISPKATVFLLLGIGIVFIALLFYTLETLLIFGTGYLISIPVSIIIYNNQSKKNVEKINKFKDTYPNIKSNKAVKDLYNLNEVRKKMRESIGFSLESESADVLRSYITLSKYLKNSTAKKIKLSSFDKKIISYSQNFNKFLSVYEKNIKLRQYNRISEKKFYRELNRSYKKLSTFDKKINKLSN